MGSVGGNTFHKPDSTVFIVLNTTEIYGSPKRVKLFNYPIDPGQERDLLSIPGVSEADIRASLLKGELNTKFKNKEVIVTKNNADLLQFDAIQLGFLQAHGITDGVQVLAANSIHTYLQDVALIGTYNGSNTNFQIPSGKFLYTGTFVITVYLNGVRQKISTNYLIAESGGPGSGFDTVIMLEPPLSDDSLVADYYLA